jgi:multidrug efflux pump subunit AcrB
MIEAIIDFAIRRRWVVVTLSLITAAIGAYALTRLPIDAVPDITNKQVQINTIAPALSPVEIEKQITFPIETALAGAPGLESTRSLSRNGFSQITAVFTERTDIYFARQQIGEFAPACRTALSHELALSRPVLVKSTRGPFISPTARPSATARPAFSATAVSSRQKDSCWRAKSRRMPICEPYRTGSSGRRSRWLPASPAWIRSAAMSNSTRSIPMRRS